MSWIFNTQAGPGTNPWSWEWGSPESFADRRSRPMDMHRLPPGHRFMRPTATAHDDNSTGWARRPVYGPHQVGRSSSCHNDEDYVQTRRRQEDYAAAHNDEDYVQTRRRPAPAIAWWWDYMDFTFRTGAWYPKARIQHGRAGDDMLMRYYRKHGTYKGAEVYIKPNVCHDPAAAAHDDYYKDDLLWETFISVAQYPEAQIEFGGPTQWPHTQFGRAEDDLLWRYYCKHDTFSGAMVYIKPNCVVEEICSEQED